MGNPEFNSLNNQVPQEKPRDSSPLEKPRDSSTNSLDKKGGGGCKESYTGFEDGTAEAEKKQDKCFSTLWECMEAHSDYYHPVLSAKEKIAEVFWKDLQVSFLPSAAGKALTECKGEAKVREEAAKLLEFLEGGACSESMNAFLDSSEEDEEKCFFMAQECMEAHSDSYQPVLALFKASEQVMRKKLEASLPPLNEDSDQPKEGEDELEVRFSEFMKRGDCLEEAKKAKWLS